MRYVEHPAPAWISHAVECVWLLDDDPAPAGAPVERIIPDGCAEIIVQSGDAFRQFSADGSAGALQPRSFLAGVLSGFWLVQPGGRVGTLGIRLRPGGVGALFGPRAEELADRATPLAAIVGSAAPELEDRVACARGDLERLAAAHRFLRETAGGARRADPVIQAAVAAVMRARGRTQIDELARFCSLSPRSLQRRFRDSVGVGPKTLSRIARFQALLLRLRGDTPARWTDHALAAGFYDQAHLVRDFREFTGQAPSRFVADAGMLSRCFAPPERLAQLLDA